MAARVVDVDPSRALAASLLFALALAGCAGDDPAQPAKPHRCAALELELADGSCSAVGPTCGAGFEPDESGGCRAVLPADPCPDGRIAVPGQPDCTEIAACGSPPWGSIPLEASTEYVDGSYAGPSVGTSDRPWTSIQDAIDAAMPDAVIAVAAGAYHEDIRIASKPVRLWGVCPDAVTIVGSTAALAAVMLLQGATGAEVHDIALSGAAGGLIVSGSEGVLLEELWIHDTAHQGVAVQTTLGATDVTLRGSLIERTTNLGILVSGAKVTVESAAVRDTRPVGSSEGSAIDVQYDVETGQRASAALRNLVLERNPNGLIVDAAEATLETSVLRAPAAVGTGQALSVTEDAPSGQRASLAVRASVIDGARYAAMVVSGSDATLEDVVITGTSPRPDGNGGGVAFQDGSTGGATASFVRSLVDRQTGAGVLMGGSTVTMEASIVRATAAHPDGSGGRGIMVEYNEATGRRADVTLRRSLVEHNREFGLAVLGCDALVEDSVVRTTEADAQQMFGDGICIAQNAKNAASATITGTRVESNARAGISNFGATVSLGSSRIGCNEFDLEGEANDAQPFAYARLAPNLCGCPAATAECQVLSTGIAPPTTGF